MDQYDFWDHCIVDAFLNKENLRILKLGQKGAQFRQAQSILIPQAMAGQLTS